MRLNQSETSELVTILAQLDGLFTPDKAVKAAIQQRCRAYFEGGLDYLAGGNNAARQASYKLLRSLAGKGLVTVRQFRGERRRVVLTHEGDCCARELCGLPLVHDCMDILDTLADEVAAGRHNRGFICAPKLPAVEKILPLLIRGWVVSLSDHCGRVGFAREELAWGEDETTVHCVERIAEEVGLPEFDPACAKSYMLEKVAVLDARGNWKPDTPHEVAIALSAGMWPGTQEAQP